MNVGQVGLVIEDPILVPLLKFCVMDLRLGSVVVPRKFASEHRSHRVQA